ncbi:MAG: ankyrin repeat domain-containing protein [Sphingobacteriia bacterium]|nr:ankyrin repeat domain-containing protein [Sphingobacteriia bacterium]
MKNINFHVSPLTNPNKIATEKIEIENWAIEFNVWALANEEIKLTREQINPYLSDLTITDKSKMTLLEWLVFTYQIELIEKLVLEKKYLLTKNPIDNSNFLFELIKTYYELTESKKLICKNIISKILNDINDYINTHQHKFENETVESNFYFKLLELSNLYFKSGDYSLIEFLLSKKAPFPVKYKIQYVLINPHIKIYKSISLKWEDELKKYNLNTPEEKAGKLNELVLNYRAKEIKIDEPNFKNIIFFLSQHFLYDLASVNNLIREEIQKVDLLNLKALELFLNYIEYNEKNELENYTLKAFKPTPILEWFWLIYFDLNNYEKFMELYREGVVKKKLDTNASEKLLALYDLYDKFKTINVSNINEIFLFLNNGAPLNLTDFKNKCSLLHNSISTAIRRRSLHELIEKYQPDFNNPLSLFNSPLTFLLRKGYNDFVLLALKKGADPYVNDLIGYNFIHELASRNNHNLMQKVLKLLKEQNKLSGLNAQNFQGNTPLHIAVKEGNLNMVIVLLAYSADLYILDNHVKGRTPLHLLANDQYFNEKILKEFFKYNANPNYPDKVGNTPFHKHLKSTRISISSLILFVKNGALFSQVNFNKKNAVDIIITRISSIRKDMSFNPKDCIYKALIYALSLGLMSKEFTTSQLKEYSRKVEEFGEDFIINLQSEIDKLREINKVKCFRVNLEDLSEIRYISKEAKQRIM